MIVDDDKEFLDEIKGMLELCEYEVKAFSNEDELLFAAFAEKPDVILLDLKIEGGSGFKIADELRRNGKTKDIPIIAITGIYTEDGHMEVIKSFGFLKRLIKPVNPLDIILAIEHAVEIKNENINLENKK